MEKIVASIITIGDELLIGQTIDTNSAWMGQRLNDAGIWVQRRVAVGDDREAIIRALDEESRLSHIILITGGPWAHRGRYYQTRAMRIFRREAGAGRSHLCPSLRHV